MAGAQLFYFSALQYLSVGVALLLEYLAPVVLIGWRWAHGDRPTPAIGVGAGLALIGLALVLDVRHGLTVSAIGVAYGLGAMLCLAGYFVLAEPKPGGQTVPPLLLTTAGTGVGAVVLLAVGATGLLPLAASTGTTTLAGGSVPWWVPMSLLIVVSAVLAYLTGVIAVRRLGSAVASFVALTEVLFAVVFAAVLLGQVPSTGQVLGGLLVLAGIVVVQGGSATAPPWAVGRVVLPPAALYDARVRAGASGLLVAGTSSDAGKSLVVTGLCRALVRRGLDVAPYKAQNMSNNSGVCADGAEIGRAQILQAAAARLEPTSAMNPVLLKPGTDRRAHVVVRGRPSGVLEAGEYATGRGHLAEAAWAAYEELEAAHDLVVCEGAGSPAEINLRAGDYVNLGLARRFGLPVVVVGDIDRGGVLASLYGTVALLEPEDRALVADVRDQQVPRRPERARAGADRDHPAYGRPLRRGAALARRRVAGRRGLPRGRGLAPVDRDLRPGLLRVAVVRLPRVSNATDVEALAAEPGRRGPGDHRPRGRRRRGPRGAARDPGHLLRPRLAAPHRDRRRGPRPGPPRGTGPRDLRRLPDARRPHGGPGRRRV